MLAAADKAHAKVVLVGDPEQLQAIEAGAAFRGVVGEVGMAELTEVRRQKHPWAREATQALARGDTQRGLAAYEERGAIIAADTKTQARAALLKEWATDASSYPQESRLILAYTREDVKELNAAAREIRNTRRELGQSYVFNTTRGERELAAHDRIIFLRNEKSLGVKNGSLGSIEAIEHGILQVRLDGKEGTRVIVDTRDYQDIDQGYATTVHKSQGSTVDRSYVLASRYFDRHSSYVALSRHRLSANLYYSNEEFAAARGQGGAIDSATARDKFLTIASRVRLKELAHDFLERETPDAALAESALEQTVPLTPSEIRAQAREDWLAARGKAQDRSQERDLGHDLDDDLSL